MTKYYFVESELYSRNCFDNESDRNEMAWRYGRNTFISLPRALLTGMKMAL